MVLVSVFILAILWTFPLLMYNYFLDLARLGDVFLLKCIKYRYPHQRKISTKVNPHLVDSWVKEMGYRSPVYFRSGDDYFIAFADHNTLLQLIMVFSEYGWFGNE
jgi:hypothetical protein